MLSVGELRVYRSSVRKDPNFLGHYPENFLPEFLGLYFLKFQGPVAQAEALFTGRHVITSWVTRIVIPDLWFCFQVASYRTLFFSCLLPPASRIWQVRYCTLFPAHWSVNPSQFRTRTLSLSFNITSAVDQFMTLTDITDHITPRPVFSLTGSHTQPLDATDWNKTSYVILEDIRSGTLQTEGTSTTLRLLPIFFQTK